MSYRSRHNAERNSRMFSYVIRAFYLAHDWASLSANLEHYDDLSGWDNIEIWETGLVLRAVASGTPITEFDCSQLLNTNLLPFLLHSSHFDAAVKASGRPRKQVFDEIIAATTPYRGQYSDYSNGALDW